MINDELRIAEAAYNAHRGDRVWKAFQELTTGQKEHWVLVAQAVIDQYWICND